ncbi:TetR/AcrR family transcriptional regulator [Bifidobacterium callimiconis]|uniref:TetR/AcrR family transcriptional regulator n=1 Tax=Bifidobacterium callimiconis TaxID=2306973 RepID=UPI001BDCE199|nr:TetR/AcrR family transcriptional regulator [Bifidobacterium callimiconis]MBT1176782.1 TetR/AcrR family transcriptional regulator [Bifidobacterium callimiconis]
MVQHRNTRTEGAIKEAFITLTNAKGFDAMTVSDLAREAHINRGTFYTHYTDKFDLRQQLLANAISDLTQIMLNPGSALEQPATSGPEGQLIPYAALLGGLRYIKNDFAFFDAISHSGNDMQLYNRTKDIITELLLIEAEKMGKKPGRDNIPAVYAREMLAASLTAIVWLWLKRGCEESPETIATIIDHARTLAPADLLN